MILNVISSFCAILLGIGIGTFIAFIISYLKKIKTKVDNIPEHKWSMRIYMDNIPQTEQNTLHLNSVPLKIYNGDKYLNLPIPRRGEEIGGFYFSGENRFEMRGIVNNVFYNTDIDLIIVSCKCVDIQKIKIVQYKEE